MNDTYKEGSYISDIFDGGTFSLFRDYCKRNNYHLLSDLRGLNFNDLYQVKGLGSLKVDKIKDRYLEYYSASNKLALIENIFSE